MEALGVVKLERVGQGGQHLVGRPVGPALFEPDVVLHADAGQLGDFLTAQTRHAPPAAGQAVVRRFDTSTTGLQEASQFAVSIHGEKYADPGTGEDDPASTRIGRYRFWQWSGYLAPAAAGCGHVPFH
ncbi:hypothetical protein Are01nite_19590 [Actinoplanes regularis]|nr:hypothetical protein Are01nite_19590 [Actinoplanes regularis]